MDGETLTYPPLLLYAVPFFLVTLLIEWRLARKKRAGSHSLKDSIASLLMGTGNLLTDLAFGFLSLSLLMSAWQFKLLDLGTLSLIHISEPTRPY